MRSFSILFFLFLFASCEKSESVIPFVDDGSGITLPENGEVPYEAMSFETNLSLVNFNQDQEYKVREAADLIKKVVASQEFKDAILNYTYKGQKSFINNGGFSNTQIYQKILNAAETLLPVKNNTIDVELELYFNAGSTIGYTYPNTRRIWMNTKYFDRYTPVQVADNLTHEWLHKLGFDHASGWSEDRDHSVPYAVGYLMERLAKQYYAP